MILFMVLMFMGFSPTAFSSPASNEEIGSSEATTISAKTILRNATEFASTAGATALATVDSASKERQTPDPDELIDGIAISEIDEVPALSIPKSSEEISNDPKTSTTEKTSTTTTTASTTTTTPPTTTTTTPPTTTTTTASSTTTTIASTASSTTTAIVSTVPSTTTAVVSTVPSNKTGTNAETVSTTSILGSTISSTAASTPTATVPKTASSAVAATTTIAATVGTSEILQQTEQLNITSAAQNTTTEEITSSPPTTEAKVKSTTIKTKPTKKPSPTRSDSVTSSQNISLQNNENDINSTSAERVGTETTERLASTTPAVSEAELKSLPSPVKNPRVTVIGYTGKPVHTFNLTEKQILYQVRVFWLEPETWRDRGSRPPNRLYDLFCWLSNDGAWVHDLLRQNFSAAIFSHSQWYAFPETEQDKKANFTVDCGLRSVNSAGKAGEWSFSEPAELREAPVFLRGFDNVNVKGWSPDEVSHLIKTNPDLKRRDAPPNNIGSKSRIIDDARNNPN